jgi:hypothetical protein
MDAARSGVAGAAALTTCVEAASVRGAAAAAVPAAGEAGGTRRCESSTNYTWAPALFPLAANTLILTDIRSGAARGGHTADTSRSTMTDIGNADRVDLMQRLVALQIEHRDLDDVIRRLANDPGRDQLQLTRMKRRKLMLKDQIARLERQIDPDVLA